MSCSESRIAWEDPTSMAQNSDYVLHNGQRFVIPYYFEFVAHVKRRWNGLEIAAFFANEFRQRTFQYYVNAIESGRIKVGGQRVEPTYSLRESETVTHFVHRHEPPVLCHPITVLHESPEVITVCKPASVPVHPCGQYRKNTVLSILQAEHNYGQLFPIHRLDRLVSGLLILARDPNTADDFRREIEAGSIRKEYVAKVTGVFPDGEVEVNAMVAYDSTEGRSRAVEPEAFDSKVSAKAGTSEPCKEKEVIEAKGRRGKEFKRKAAASKSNLPVVDSHDRAKPACTKFRRHSTDGVTSVVICTPLTGRTHQIRVHLQHLGHPIANDALYSCAFSSSSRVHSGTCADKAAAVQASSHGGSEVPQQAAQPLPHDTNSNGNDTTATVEESCQLPKRPRILGSGMGETSVPVHAEKLSITREEEHQSEDLVGVEDNSSKQNGNATESSTAKEMSGPGVVFEIDPMCTQCPSVGASGYEEVEEPIWLHCVKYSGSNNWEYECPLPLWALDQIKTE